MPDVALTNAEQDTGLDAKATSKQPDHANSRLVRVLLRSGADPRLTIFSQPWWGRRTIDLSL
jgi:hypothetical protein